MLMSLCLCCVWPGVGAVVHRGQVLEVQVGVDLRGADVGVAEHFLYRAQVLGRFQQVAGEGMAKHVRVQVLAKLALAGGLHPQLDGPRAQAFALAGDEHRAVLRAADAAQAQPGL